MAALFVFNNAHLRGISKQQLNKIKESYSKLSLTVYKKNVKAICLY